MKVLLLLFLFIGTNFCLADEKFDHSLFAQKLENIYNVKSGLNECLNIFKDHQVLLG